MSSLILRGAVPNDGLSPSQLLSMKPDEARLLFGKATKPFSVVAQVDDSWVVATDHLGMEPLFYARSGSNKWVVAETVEEILRAPPHSETPLDEASIVGHIAGPYAPRPGSTFFAGVHAVIPGTLVRLTPEGSEETSYWEPLANGVDRSMTLAQAATKLRRLLFEVVPEYLSGTPVAVTLSSGMDSTTVLAALVESKADVLAVAWTSPDIPEADEAAWARLTAAKLGVPLVELAVTTGSLLPEAGIVTHRSTPLFNVFDHMWSAMSQKAAEKSRQVLFTGFSGDHLFGGWVSAAVDSLLELRPIHTARYLFRSRPRYPNLLRALRTELLSPLARQAATGAWARRQSPVPWLHPEYRNLWLERQVETLGPGLRPGRAERLSGLSDGLISQLAEDMTIQTQPYGVELRHPFLDRRLVEFALSLPSWMLNDGNTDKLVLRQAMRGILPDEVVELENILPGPIARQAIRARADPILALTRDMHAADLGFVSEPVLAQHVAGFMREEHDDMSFWNTLTLEDWLRRFW